jgi:hypothetical protein
MGAWGSYGEGGKEKCVRNFDSKPKTCRQLARHKYTLGNNINIEVK